MQIKTVQHTTGPAALLQLPLREAGQEGIVQRLGASVLLQVLEEGVAFSSWKRL